jgi:hypothetical protein
MAKRSPASRRGLDFDGTESRTEVSLKSFTPIFSLLLVLPGMIESQPLSEAVPPDSSFAVGTKPNLETQVALSPPLQLKREDVAYAWALGATLVPFVPAAVLYAIQGPTCQDDSECDRGAITSILALSGAFLGPSAGQLYAGSTSQGVKGVLFRLSSIIVLVALGDPYGDEVTWVVASSLSGLVFVAGTVYSFWDTPKAVRRANARARNAAMPKTSLSPMLYPARDGRLAPGLAFNASF